jgi:hypothetical protein
MSSLFDPTAILNASLDTNATRRDPLPMGEVVAQITAQEVKNGTSRSGEPWYRLDVKLEISDPEYLAPTGLEKATIRYGVMLDITEAGTIAMGPNKNVALGRLRAATGTNAPGKTLQDMVGQYVRAQISHRPDPNDPSVVYDDVKGVTSV